MAPRLEFIRHGVQVCREISAEAAYSRYAAEDFFSVLQ
jgi:hypothetical protein